jgi:23S rRNA (uracil1939-C5)-methyltransferase
MTTDDIRSDMPVGFRYRNKAQFPIGADRDGNPVAGFYAARTHDIIPMDDCLLGVEENRMILDLILAHMRQYHIKPYDEATGDGLVRHVLIRKGFATEELMVCLILNGSAMPRQDELVERLSQIDGMKSISVNRNTERTNVILGAETSCIWGEPYITDLIHLRNCADDFAATDTAIAYQISPQSFYQVNPIQTEKLYSLALDYAGLTGTESVWDLYCGIGTISLFLAQKAGQVYGVEIVPRAIEDAKRNARLNGITNAEFFVGKAEEVLPGYYADHAGDVDCAMSHPDVIVVDPPRKG